MARNVQTESPRAVPKMRSPIPWIGQMLSFARNADYSRREPRSRPTIARIALIGR